MTEFFARLFEHDGTLQSFDGEDDVHAPDEYIHKFVKMESGSIAFVEVATDKAGPWALWRVECVAREYGFLALLTARCAESEARAELAKLGVS